MHGAREAFANKNIWSRLQKNAMTADFSWDRSAAEYVKLYKRLAPAPAVKRPAAPRRTPSPRNRGARAASKNQR